MDVRLPTRILFRNGWEIFLAFQFAVAVTVGQPAMQIDFDGSTTLLQAQEGSSKYQVLLHQIDRQHHQFGKGCERVSLRCSAGHSAPLGVAVGRAPVIEEFRATLWLMTNRPGAQLAARVVLPRSLSPATGRPLELMLRGSNLSQGSQWEAIKLRGLPDALADMARVARTQQSKPIDERGAYVSELVLLLPGGPGLSETLVDRLQVFGVLSDVANEDTTRKHNDSEITTIDSQPLPEVPRVPRIIRWQGEPLELLSRLGFQAVGMDRTPRPQEIEEAKRYGLYLVCPPPSIRQITNEGIGKKLDSVLVWDLGQQLSTGDLQHMIRWQQLIKRHDGKVGRRLLLSPQMLTREASRIADIVLLDRPILGAGLTLRDYATWMSQRTRLARPGTPIWSRIHTQLSAEQENQLRAFSPRSSFGYNAAYNQLVSTIAASIGVKSAGFYFESRSSLAQNDATAQQRAQALELSNLRLGLMEPWLAAGKLLASARSNDSEMTALVMQAERSHLLVPVSWSDRLEGAETPAREGPMWFIVPGVAESSEAYLLTLGGPQRLRHNRVTGGIRVSLEQLPSDSLVLLTDDPSAFSQVARYLRRIAPRATKLRRDLAASRVETAADNYPSISSNSLSQEQLQATLAGAQQTLSDCDSALASRNYELAYELADAAERTIARTDLLLWQEVAKGRSAAEIPLAIGVNALPELQRLPLRWSGTSYGQNLLAEGGFENLQSLLDAGWRHKKLPLEGIQTAVRLSPTAPHTGQYCLELEAAANDSTLAPVVPTAPVWIKSRPVHLRAGDILEITGVARVPQSLIGSVDGLQIFDTLGGSELATRVRAAPSWQPFRMIRTTSSDTEVSVVIAMSGLGIAQVDDLSFRLISQGQSPHATDGRPREIAANSAR